MTTQDEGAPAQPTGDEGPLPAGVTAASPWIRLGALVLESVLFLVTLGIGWVIWALVIVGRGQTPAKALLNLRVVDTGSLKPVGFARMFWVREIVAGIVAGLAIPLTLGVLLFMPFGTAATRTSGTRSRAHTSCSTRATHGAPSPISRASPQTRPWEPHQAYRVLRNTR